MNLKRAIVLVFLFAVMFAADDLRSEVTVKVRDISFIDGLKENQVVGYGLVVGLQGSGDTKKTPLAKSYLKNLLKNLGMDGEDAFSQNTAAVIVTAQLPPFVRIGDRIDVSVSSIGDAKSLEGGVLIQSVLKGADDIIYVAAQGPLSVSRGKPGGTRKDVRTSAVVNGGGLVEREIENDMVADGSIFIVLKNLDFSVANNIIKAVEAKWPDTKPELTKGGKIKIGLIKNVPLQEFIAGIESLEVEPAAWARVVVSERDGTIVAGGDVKISEAMISREGMTIEIKGSEKKVSAAHLKSSANVKDLVDAMNAAGANTADIMAILKALKASGALHAELIVR